MKNFKISVEKEWNEHKFLWNRINNTARQRILLALLRTESFNVVARVIKTFSQNTIDTRNEWKRFSLDLISTKAEWESLKNLVYFTCRPRSCWVLLAEKKRGERNEEENFRDEKVSITQRDELLDHHQRDITPLSCGFQILFFHVLLCPSPLTSSEILGFKHFFFLVFCGVHDEIN